MSDSPAGGSGEDAVAAADEQGSAPVDVGGGQRPRRIDHVQLTVSLNVSVDLLKQVASELVGVDPNNLKELNKALRVTMTRNKRRVIVLLEELIDTATVADVPMARILSAFPLDWSDSGVDMQG